MTATANTLTPMSTPAPAIASLVEDSVPVAQLQRQIAQIRELYASVMQERYHYGTIPGTRGPTLYQPGGDLILSMFKLDTEPEVISSTRQEHFISYTVRVRLRHCASGQYIATGLGSCNTREDRHAKTIATRHCDPWDLDNTILKMATKRAKMAAIFAGTAARELFTSPDEEDFGPPGSTAPSPPQHREPMERPPRRRGRPPSRPTASPPAAPPPPPADAPTEAATAAPVEPEEDPDRKAELWRQWCDLVPLLKLPVIDEIRSAVGVTYMNSRDLTIDNLEQAIAIGQAKLTGAQ